MSLPLAISPASISTINLTSGQAYSSGVLFTASGGNQSAPYQWSVVSGTLPTGVSLVVSGVNNEFLGVSGTPSEIGSFSQVVQVQDASLTTVQATIPIQVASASSASSSGGGLWAIMPDIVHCSRAKWEKKGCPDIMLVNGVRYIYKNQDEDDRCCFEKEAPFGHLYGQR